MARTRALVISEPGLDTRDLNDALYAGGFEVSHATAGGLSDREELGSVPDILLVSASLGLQHVALLSQQFSHASKPPTVVVFPQGDFDALEACVRGGFDYVTPPYLSTLLRSRMLSCWQRGQLVTAVEDMSAEASLHAYERDMSIAHEIQAGFLPDSLPAPYGWDLASRFRPAKQVAGDFYDGFELVHGRRLGFVVADVCDKGVGAALFMALIRTLLRHTAEHTGAGSLAEDTDIPVTSAVDAGVGLPPLLSVGAGPLLQAVVGTNRYLARNHLRQGYFATLFFGVLDPVSGALLYINGGHNPPVHLRAAGGQELLRPTGPAVGMMAHGNYSLGHVGLEPGDTLFVYTDGVPEARGHDGGRFGMNRMLDRLSTDVDSESLLAGVEDSVRGYVGSAEQSDDITMLAIHRRPTPERSRDLGA
jgi:hypothetical protein